MKTQLCLKHSRRCLPDLGMAVEIVDEWRRTTLTMRTFDDALVPTAVTGILPERAMFPRASTLSSSTQARASTCESSSALISASRSRFQHDRGKSI